MAGTASESFILRTYPLREADLIVSFFAREQGKLRGVARRARRPKSNFGAGLERLSHVQLYYFARENRELASIDSCDLIHSPFAIHSAGGYDATIALDFIAEVADHLLPPHEPSERFFRLLLAVTQHMAADPERHIWPAILYFAFWAVRLSGFLPQLALASDSLQLVEQLARLKIDQLPARQWGPSTAIDLRRLLVRAIEDHIERRLLTAPQLEALAAPTE